MNTTNNHVSNWYKLRRVASPASIPIFGTESTLIFVIQEKFVSLYINIIEYLLQNIMNHIKLHLSKLLTLAIILMAFAGFCACNDMPEEPATVAGYTNLEDLDGHSVGVVTGSTMDVMLSDSDNFPFITIMRYRTPSELIKAVQNGTADCGITDTVQLMTLSLEKHGLAIDFNLPGGFDVAAAFKQKDEKLCQQFNDFIAQLKSDGTIDTMMSRWCSAKMDTVAMPQFPELANLKGHPLEVATLADNEPFSFYRDNTWTGFEVELMLRFSISIGRPVHFSGYTFDEILSTLLTNKADIACADLFITPDRSNRVLYSTPYYFCKTSCFSKAKN